MTVTKNRFVSGLNNSLKYLEERNLSLHNYTYSEEYLEAIMLGMKEVNFSGASVSVCNSKPLIQLIAKKILGFLGLTNVRLSETYVHL